VYLQQATTCSAFSSHKLILPVVSWSVLDAVVSLGRGRPGWSWGCWGHEPWTSWRRPRRPAQGRERYKSCDTCCM